MHLKKLLNLLNYIQIQPPFSIHLSKFSTINQYIDINNYFKYFNAELLRKVTNKMLIILLIDNEMLKIGA